MAQSRGGQSEQQNTRRYNGYTDDLEIIIVPFRRRLGQHEAERSQRQVNVVMGLPIDADGTAEKDVELVEVAADHPPQGFAGIARVLRLLYPISRYLGFHGSSLVLDQFEVLFVVPEQACIERLDETRGAARLLLVHEATQSRPIVLETAARAREVRHLDAAHFRRL